MREHSGLSKTLAGVLVALYALIALIPLVWILLKLTTGIANSHARMRRGAGADPVSARS